MDASPSPLARSLAHAGRLNDHGEVGEEAQVRRRASSNLSIHPQASVDELHRGSQVQCHPGGLYDHRALEHVSLLEGGSVPAVSFFEVSLHVMVVGGVQYGDRERPHRGEFSEKRRAGTSRTSTSIRPED